MERKHNLLLLLLSILSGILLWLSWPPKNTTFLIFVAFVPLLMVVILLNQLHPKRPRFSLFLYVLAAMLIWNLLSTYWIYKATLPGAVAAIILNSLLMVLPFALYDIFKNSLKKESSFILLVIFWVSLEYLHFNWDLAWPWLTLGNSLATYINIVQWYEYTGVLGGSIWIWTVNILVFNLLRVILENKSKDFFTKYISKHAAILLFIILIPILFSLFIAKRIQWQPSYNVLIVQPNIDPYNEKFSAGTFEDQLDKLLRLSISQADSNSSLLIWPETALSASFDEETLNNDQAINEIRLMLSRYPDLTLISGISSYRFFGENEKPTPTARYYKPWDKYYDSYNSAILLNTSDKYELYHKSRLVPGVEIMPYPQLFSFLSKLAIDLGGTSGSLGRQRQPSVFNIGNGVVVAPVICYESIFGDYVAEFVRKGANTIAVMTNDGWWGNTAGHRQHLYYARLLAVSHRRDIVRSANTGISAYINLKGEVVEKSDWWIEGVIKQKICINNELTFYSKYGDYLGRMSSIIAVLLLIILLVFRIKLRIDNPLKKQF